MPIPTFSQCEEMPEYGCPKLSDQLNSLLSVVLGAVRDAVPEPWCPEESIVGYVGLAPVALDFSDQVIVFAERVQMVTPQALTRGAQPGMARTQVTAVALVAFYGNPTVDVVGEEFVLPPANEMAAASTFVINVSWCVWCAVWRAIADGSLLTGVTGTIATDGITVDLVPVDLDGGMAGFELRLKWYV